MRVGDRGGGPGAQLWTDRRGEAVGGGGADAETVAVAVAVAVEAGEREPPRYLNQRWKSWIYSYLRTDATDIPVKWAAREAPDRERGAEMQCHVSHGSGGSRDSHVCLLGGVRGLLESS